MKLNLDGRTRRIAALVAALAAAGSIAAVFLTRPSHAFTASCGMRLHAIDSGAMKHEEAMRTLQSPQMQTAAAQRAGIPTADFPWMNAQYARGTGDFTLTVVDTSPDIVAPACDAYVDEALLQLPGSRRLWSSDETTARTAFGGSPLVTPLLSAFWMGFFAALAAVSFVRQVGVKNQTVAT